jgi:deazaflavin-dependent oxidoreductase (nitroreductase family)
MSSAMKGTQSHFVAPNWLERAVNRFYGSLASAGLGPAYSYLLTIQGRKTGTPYSTPVNVLRFEQRLYLVGTRGHTQWSRNALVVKTATLKRGRILMEFDLRPLADAEKPEILKAYLRQFNWMVRRFFSIPSDSPVAAFAAVAQHYPVFELVRK